MHVAVSSVKTCAILAAAAAMTFSTYAEGAAILVQNVSGTGGTASAATSVTLSSYAVSSGAARILVVQVVDSDGNGSADDVATGLTYGGTPLSLAGVTTPAGQNSNGGDTSSRRMIPVS